MGEVVEVVGVDWQKGVTIINRDSGGTIDINAVRQQLRYKAPKRPILKTSSARALQKGGPVSESIPEPRYPSASSAVHNSVAVDRQRPSSSSAVGSPTRHRGSGGGAVPVPIALPRHCDSAGGGSGALESRDVADVLPGSISAGVGPGAMAGGSGPTGHSHQYRRRRQVPGGDDSGVGGSILARCTLSPGSGPPSPSSPRAWVRELPADSNASPHRIRYTPPNSSDSGMSSGAISAATTAAAAGAVRSGGSPVATCTTSGIGRSRLRSVEAALGALELPDVGEPDGNGGPDQPERQPLPLPLPAVPPATMQRTVGLRQGVLSGDGALEGGHHGRFSRQGPWAGSRAQPSDSATTDGSDAGTVASSSSPVASSSSSSSSISSTSASTRFQESPSSASTMSTASAAKNSTHADDDFRPGSNGSATAGTAAARRPHPPDANANSAATSAANGGSSGGGRWRAALRQIVRSVTQWPRGGSDPQRPHLSSPTALSSPSNLSFTALRQSPDGAAGAAATDDDAIAAAAAFAAGGAVAGPPLYTVSSPVGMAPRPGSAAGWRSPRQASDSGGGGGLGLRPTRHAGRSAQEDTPDDDPWLWTVSSKPTRLSMRSKDSTVVYRKRMGVSMDGRCSFAAARAAAAAAAVAAADEAETLPLSRGSDTGQGNSVTRGGLPQLPVAPVAAAAVAAGQHSPLRLRLGAAAREGRGSASLLGPAGLARGGSSSSIESILDRAGGRAAAAAAVEAAAARRRRAEAAGAIPAVAFADQPRCGGGADSDAETV